MAHSLFGEHVQIMQETTGLAELCKPRATWNEVGRPLLEMGVVFVFGCVWLCLVVLVCVVFVVLLVAVDALAVVW